VLVQDLSELEASARERFEEIKFQLRRRGLLKRLASTNISALDSGAKPLDPLLGGSGGPARWIDIAGTLALEPIVPDCGSGIQAFFYVSSFQQIALPIGMKSRSSTF